MSAAYEVLLDAHVHYHPCFSMADFCSAAVGNLRAGAVQLGLDEATLGGLMFTESHGANSFEAMRGAAVSEPPADLAEDGWWLRTSKEHNSLWACHGAAASERLLLVAGRQVVTSERLEVLALGCGRELPDGMKLAEAVEAVLGEDSIPVVPWGFGKWWRERGRLVSELLETAAGGRFYLGDNAGRLRFGARPRLFEHAAERGIFVLPGSDPLPFTRQVEKTGRCGFLVDAGFDPEYPAASIVDWLRANTRQPETFGSYESLGNFVRDQLAMQLRKRRGNPGSIANPHGGPA